MMAIILEAGLMPRLDDELQTRGIEPGFADRAQDVAKLTHFEDVIC